jgi:hypothetical protein
MRISVQFGCLFCSAGLFLSASFSSAMAEEYLLHRFERIQLSDQFFCEGASAGDFNQDGMTDIVSGPYWYAGPNYGKRQTYYPAKPFDINGYSDNFLTFAHDIDHDTWTDIVVIGFPDKEAYWYKNPQNKSVNWTRHLIHPVVGNESPTLADVTGDDVPELVFNTGGQLGYAQLDPDGPTRPWTFHAISPPGDFQRFTHGLGVGDVSGDGRTDLLEKNGWWEQPPVDAKAPFWTFHPVPFTQPGGAQMFAYDFDGDGDNDVVTSTSAHAYGLSWFEQVLEDDAIAFREHKIMGATAAENPYGVVFSQPHAMVLADMNRDGILDLVTGKRFWAHNGHDPGARDPAVSYWFQTVRAEGSAHFVPHLIDRNSGVGTQVTAADVNGDDWPDVVVGNKKGTFVLLQHVQKVDQATWEAAQPKRLLP